jgi:hypothetical protein
MSVSPQGTSFSRKTETVILDISSILNKPVEIPVQHTEIRTVPEEPGRVVTLRMYHISCNKYLQIYIFTISC